MPTAAKLVAAICLAALGYAASETVKTLMPDGTDFGIFTLVNAGIGFACGWLILGNRAGRGYSAALSNGFTGMVALVFWALFVQAAYEMVALALRRRFEGPVEAAAAVFEIMAEYGAVMLDLELILLLMLGAFLAGVLSEGAARRWR
jgi:hypothetical protein